MPAPRMSPTMKSRRSLGPITRLRSGEGPLTSVGSLAVAVISVLRVRATGLAVVIPQGVRRYARVCFQPRLRGSSPQLLAPQPAHPLVEVRAKPASKPAKPALGLD